MRAEGMEGGDDGVRGVGVVTIALWYDAWGGGVRARRRALLLEHGVHGEGSGAMGKPVGEREEAGQDESTHQEHARRFGTWRGLYKQGHARAVISVGMRR
jgi:hypothetical protein